MLGVEEEVMVLDVVLWDYSGLKGISIVSIALKSMLLRVEVF